MNIKIDHLIKNKQKIAMSSTKIEAALLILILAAKEIWDWPVLRDTVISL